MSIKLLNTLITAQVEQNKRRMRGIYVKPEQGVAGSYNNAGTGVLYTLLRYVHQYDIKPHASDVYRSYAQATMLAAVQEFIADVRASITEDMDLDQHCIYLNKNHKLGGLRMYVPLMARIPTSLVRWELSISFLILPFVLFGCLTSVSFHS